MCLFPNPVISLDPLSPSCQNSEGCFADFIVHLESPEESPGNDSTPAKLFQKIMTSYDGTELAKRAQVRYAHWLKESSPEKAIPLLTASLQDYPILGDYLTFWLGQAYGNAGLEKKAIENFEKFNGKYTDSVLRAEALYIAGSLATKISDCETALPLWSQALRLDPEHSKAAEGLFQLGLCAEQLGQKEKAIESFRKLWWKYPLAPENAQAEPWLRKKLASSFLPTLEERIQRGMTLYDKGALDEAIQEFQRVISQSPPTPEYFNIQFKRAMAFVRLKQYEQAESLFTKLLQTSSSKTNDAWVWLGRVYLRQGKGSQLESLVRTRPAKLLTGDQQSLISTFYGIWLEDRSRWREAGNAYKSAAEVAHTLSQRVDGLWRVGWLHYQQNQFREAIDIFDAIIRAVKTPQSESSLRAASQAAYWLARSQEHLGQGETASRHYEDLSREYPFTYYGQLAKLRLGSSDWTPKGTKVSASEEAMNGAPPPALLQDIHYQKIQVLHGLQFFKEAVEEFEVVYNQWGGNQQAFSGLVLLASDIGAYDIGIRLAIRHFGATLRKGQLSVVSPAWVGAFPMGYQRIIQSFVPKHVDPFLVAGLIREESLYSARVVSPVGAIGLMQLMPATAQKMAHQLRLDGLEVDVQDLSHPAHNIRLGTHYLGQLINEFQGNIVYSVAAYNAGPQAVRRWIAQNGQRDPDEFVELIGYRETQEYVKRVVGSYRIYRMLFGNVCRGISLDRFC